MDTELFTVVSSKTLHAARFEIIEDELDIDGKAARYSFVKIKPGVCVIVETPDGFVLQKEYRYPIRAWTYEFTAGVIDACEAPETTARREVEEETGYIADELTALGKFYPSFGPTDEVIYLFYAKCSQKKETNKEYTEFISNEVVDKKRVEELIINGEFRHGAGLAAWLRYKLMTQS